jgi:hypothetical protein
MHISDNLVSATSQHVIQGHDIACATFLQTLRDSGTDYVSVEIRLRLDGYCQAYAVALAGQPVQTRHRLAQYVYRGSHSRAC